MLHPDVPKTGSTEAFLAIKNAYDVLSDYGRRAAYDRKAASDPLPPVYNAPPAAPSPPPFYEGSKLVRQPRFSGVPVAVWAGLAAFLGLSMFEAVSHVMALAPIVHSDIRPNAAAVAPLPAGAERAILYGPAPLRLAGAPNFYVVPSGSPAVLWRMDPDRKVLVSLGQLPPFSAVQAVRLVRQTGMLEVLINDKGNGFIAADHLAPGNVVAAKVAYCSFNAGPAPFDGELLERQGSGPGTLAVRNRSVQPVVLKLRDDAGAVKVSVFLDPGSEAGLRDLPEGRYHPEFAIGELWSRACGVFAAGMRARRMDVTVQVPDAAQLVVGQDGDGAGVEDIPDQAFARQ